MQELASYKKNIYMIYHLYSAYRY